MSGREVMVAVGVLLLGFCLGCGSPESAPQVKDAEATTVVVESEDATDAAPSGAVGAAFQWEDPEPPDAQALAESVLDAAWNVDRTTRLVMNITTLVDRTTGIEGFRSALDGDGVSLDDRLDGLGAKITDTDVTISLSGSILFDFDSAAIRADADRTLGEVVEVIKAYAGRPVRVEGHTDSIASEAYNERLSMERAGSVAAWLGAHEVNGSRLVTLGHGETQPVADNDTVEGRQLNRRVEIIIEK